MARSVIETANILSDIYHETFKNDYSEKFCITWPQLRSIMGVPRLKIDLVTEINNTLAEPGFVLIPFDDYLLVAAQTDFIDVRKVPDRIVEQYVADGEDEPEDEDEDE